MESVETPLGQSNKGGLLAKICIFLLVAFIYGVFSPLIFIVGHSCFVVWIVAGLTVEIFHGKGVGAGRWRHKVVPSEQVPTVLFNNSLYDNMTSDVGSLDDVESLQSYCGKYTTRDNPMYERGCCKQLHNGCDRHVRLVPSSLSGPRTPASQKAVMPTATPSPRQPEMRRAVSPALTGPFRSLTSLLAGVCSATCGAESTPAATSALKAGARMGDSRGRQPSYMQPTAASQGKMLGTGHGESRVANLTLAKSVAGSMRHTQRVPMGLSEKRRWL